MSEKGSIKQTEIGEVLNMLVLGSNPEKKEWADEEKYFALKSVVVSFLLAKRHPELADACALYWDFNHSMKSEKLLDWWLELYEAYREAYHKDKQENKE
ncbi:hypothetical protein ACFLTZ_01305 [Chloroflexota bacterium]